MEWDEKLYESREKLVKYYNNGDISIILEVFDDLKEYFIKNRTKDNYDR